MSTQQSGIFSIQRLFLHLLFVLALASQTAGAQHDNEFRQECVHELLQSKSKLFLGLALMSENCESKYYSEILDHHQNSSQILSGTITIPKAEHPEHCRILTTIVPWDICDPDGELCE